MILENIWEGEFQNCSHGFRPNRSCHKALLDIQKSFGGAKWFIEGDICAFFDNIDHGILISILRKRIKDEWFIRLIWKFMFYSMLRTLGRKYRKSMKQIRMKYDVDWKFGISYSNSKGDKTLTYYDGGFRRDKLPSYDGQEDVKVEYRYPFGRYSPAYKLKQKTCGLCGATNINVFIHHVRKLKDIRPDSPWNIRMIEMKRKTLPVCEHCYSRILQAS